MTALVFTWEPFWKLMQEGLPKLAEQSWQETWSDEQNLKFNPDWVRYGRMEQDNIMRVFSARNDGKLVGYSVVLIGSELHDKDTQHAVIQDFYLSPECRKGLNGVKMFLELHNWLQKLGAKCVTVAERYVVKSEKGGIGKIFARLGYQSQERLWKKALVS